MDEGHRSGYEGRGRGRGGNYSHRGGGGGYRGGNYRGGRGAPYRGSYGNQNQRGGQWRDPEEGGGGRLQGRISRCGENEESGQPTAGIQGRLSRQGVPAEENPPTGCPPPRNQGYEQGLPRRVIRPPNSYSAASVPQVQGGFGVPPPEEREGPFLDPIGASMNVRPGLDRPQARLRYMPRFGDTRQTRIMPMLAQNAGPPRTSTTNWKKSGNQNQKRGKSGPSVRQFMQEELDKVKKYPKGINGEGRSDYEKEEAIPTFGESETERDKEICTDLFEAIRKGPPVTADKVWKYYEDAISEKETDSRLESQEQLEEFLRQHPHVFEVDDVGRIVSNQGFGYRRGMVYLVCIIKIHEQDSTQGAKLTDVFEEIAALPTYEVGAAWLDDYLWRVPMDSLEQLLQFLEEEQNEFIFEVAITDPSNPEENAFIRIKEEALKIPSLWDSTLLLLELDKNTSWWDQSRRYVLQATVTVSQEDFAEACIGHGPFATRYVFVVPADVGQGTTSLSKKYQAGNQVEIIAFQTLITKKHVTAVYLKLSDFDRRFRTVEDRFKGEKELLARLRAEGEGEQKNLDPLAPLMDEEEEEEDDSQSSDDSFGCETDEDDEDDGVEEDDEDEDDGKDEEDDEDDEVSLSPTSSEDEEEEETTGKEETAEGEQGKG